MSRRFVSNLVVALGLVVSAPLALRAQARTPSPEPVSAWSDRFTLGGAFGGLSGAANLNTAGTADWRLGWIGSIDGTVWLQRNVGIRASGSWAQDSLRGAALPGRGKFNKFSYDAALVLRHPIQAGSATLSPYVLGGAGAISVHQLDASDTWTKFAGNFGAGLEYRFGRIGLRAEGRDFVYKFDRYGFDKTQHDIAWQGGLTLTF
ncbi:MAG TPA: outer membrane beta-barrel protein [Gemmatimonadales bacterium]|nr:outer membrane beta-barrel protein [Gemmatimonadales bacterium]